MTKDALKVLAHMRDSTGHWFTRPDLRIVLGANPAGFGEPVVGMALESIRRAGIEVEESVMYLDPRSQGENVYRLA